MAVFRIERTRDYTVMSNHHLRNANLSLKAKGLLSMMLSLPEDWNYTTRGLAKICKEGVDTMSSCSMMAQSIGSVLSGTTYPSDDPEMLAVEADYAAREVQLQEEIDNIENSHPGYDEYRYDLGMIGHDPHELAAFLSAVLQGYTRQSAQTELARVFAAQYQLTLTEEVEIRYRTETSTDPETGETTSEEVPYEYYILNVKLTSKPISAVASELLTPEQMEMYQVYRQTMGNKPLLFGGGSPDMSNSEDLTGVQFVNGTRPGTEAVAIRKIFELYTSSEIGLGGIANQLNLQGIRKIPRQNGTLEDWTGHFIKLILDNPVYCGKIAYGRRTKEKVKGTKNDYQMKRNDDYILTEGQHKGIVSEEVWEKAHAKRLRTGVKQPSKIGRDRVHLLSGLLKCPVCGSPMYTNKHAWTNKDGTYKEIYYYVCSRNRMVRGKHCEYKAMLKKTDIEPMVIEAIREIVRNEEYAQAIKKRIGVQIDTKAVDKELEGYQAKLKEVDLNKTRLEREIDSLPADAKYRERKLHDMTLRLDSLYDVIVELEEKIEDARLRRDAIKQQAITLENIYKIMVNFDCVYNIINDEEKRNVVTALIKEIEIYRNDESEYPLKRIGLNFPVFKDGGEVTELLWDKGNTVETVCLLVK